MSKTLIPITPDMLTKTVNANTKQVVLVKGQELERIDFKDLAMQVGVEANDFAFENITLTTPNPAKKGFYFPTEAGLYPNFGGIEVINEKLEELVLVIIFDGINFNLIEKSFPALGEVKEGDNRAVSGGEVFEKTLVKAEVMNRVLNLINPDDIVPNTSFSWITGYMNYSITDRWGIWLKIEQGQDYFVQGRDINLGGRSEVAFFVNMGSTEEAISFIRHEPTPNTFYNLTFTPPSGANYAFINIAFTSDINPFLTTFMVSKGTTEKPFEPYGYAKIKSEYLTGSSIFENSEEPISSKAIGEYVTGKNKINKEDIILSPYFSPIQNSMWPGEPIGLWRGVWVNNGFEVGKSYTISGRGNRLEVAFFGEDRVVDLSFVQSNSFTVPSGTEAIFINIDNTGTDDFNDTVMMRLSSENADYEPYEQIFMLRKSITQVNNSEQSDLDVVLNIPDVLPAVIDDNLQLYRNGVVLLPDLYSYDCTFVCSEGRNFPRLFELKPTSVGNVNATFNVKNQMGVIVKSKNFQIQKYDELTSPATQKNILVVGASATANGYFTAELNRRLTTTTGDGTPINPTGLGLTNIDFVGRKTSLGVNLEATGGWSWRDYTTQGRPAYRFYVTDVDSININDIYTVNGMDLTVAEINITGGIGNIRCTYTVSGAIPASGILTRVTGTGDSSITYTSYDSESFNPFWNNGSLDFQNYANLYCNGSIDVLITHCGVNDMFTSRSIDEIFEDIKIFANALFLDFPNCKLIITSLPLPCPIGGMGQNYGAVNGMDYYSKALRFSEFFEKAEQLQKEIEYSGKIFHCPVVSQFDNEHGYPTTTSNVNNRSSELYIRGANGVHPTENGAKLIADAIYRTLHLTGL